MNKEAAKGRHAILGILFIAGLTFWFSRGPSDCKEAARPLIYALERYRKVHGRYPVLLDSLVREGLLQALPRPTWNLNVRHGDKFDYWAQPDLDFFCLSYAERPTIATHWDKVSYLSFRGVWDDVPGTPACDPFSLPIEQAGELFQKSRSSPDLRRLIKIVCEYPHIDRHNPWSVYWEDIAPAIGKVSPLTRDDIAGLCVEAEDAEGAAFGFVTKPAHTSFGDKHEVVLIWERELEGNHMRWREIFAKSKRLD